MSSNSDFEFRDDATIQAVFNMEVGREQNNHNFLYNRSFPNQHPIEAITGLEDALTNNAAAIQAEENRAKGVEGNLENLTTANKENLVSAINEIQEKIPSAASSINQLTDKSYVDNADNNLQQQIDVISASSDVTDIVGTYAELQEYDTAKLKNNDIIKVLQDETQDNAISYYRWTISGHVGSFSLIGVEGPYYTKAAANITFVPQTRAINSKELTADIELNYTDVGADAAGAASSAETNAKNYADSLSSNYATAAQGAKADTALQQSDVSSIYSSTGTAPVNGTAVASAISTKANIGLDNLNADGQMVIDSQNGTVSNCVLEIPQNVKCSMVYDSNINKYVFTLYSGSILTQTGLTYSTQEITASSSINFSSSAGTERYLYISVTGGAATITLHADYDVNKSYSGHTSDFPTANLGDSTTYYDIDTAKWYRYRSSQQDWIEISRYPVAVVKRDTNNVFTIVQVFNGALYLGHHSIVLPNLKGLVPNGITSDGNLASTGITTNAVQIIAMSTNTVGGICLSTTGTAALSDNNAYYDYDNNMYYRNSSDTNTYLNIVKYATDEDSYVTDFTIRQPYEGCRDLITDKKQNDITSITGYDATKTQTLKNVSGVLTWVDD